VDDDVSAAAHELSRDSARLRLLYELGCAFAARVRLDELTALVLAKCREVLDARGASILLLDAERRELYFPYVAEHPDVAERLVRLRFPADRGIAGAVLRTGRSVRVDDVAADSRFYGGVDRSTGVATRNLLCVPLRSDQGLIGVIQVVNRRVDGGFTDGDLAFLEALAGSVAIAIENARIHAQLQEQVVALERAVREHNELVAIRRELDVASEIQQSILPRSFPPFPERSDFAIFAAMLPAREVGGDFYDFFLVDDTRLAVVIGDVSGKGVPAALFMAVSRTLLKAVATTNAAPGECLQRVNRLLCLDNGAEQFVTIVYGVLDTHTGTFEYSTGGHTPPYLLRDGRVQRLEQTPGMVLGIIDEASYGAKTIALRRGDGIFLYTDGVTEAMDASDAPFSDERLETVLRHPAGADPEALIRQVVGAVQTHAGDAPQSDDITALAVTYVGGGS
jgi:serine phosphatase RsbU (regulator of sigma subunit)